MSARQTAPPQHAQFGLATYTLAVVLLQFRIREPPVRPRQRPLLTGSILAPLAIRCPVATFQIRKPPPIQSGSHSTRWLPCFPTWAQRATRSLGPAITGST